MSESKITLSTVYGMNQQIMSQMAPIEAKKLDMELANVGAWFGSQKGFQYFMLLNNDRHDYTVFNLRSPNYHQAIKELKMTLEYRGPILSIEYNHDSCYYEIWVKIDDIAHMFILFPCNDFVIEV